MKILFNDLLDDPKYSYKSRVINNHGSGNQQTEYILVKISNKFQMQTRTNGLESLLEHD